ncbi:hypothetical protein L1987_24106 [Smallanthus sonchifolius]|uniref:Uncharacterized protein n=1 Tax=Smallanthus sonchifolius TaxID=185202 RepID=A0ACB9IL93_9ASTR|nr:hypothetical protein L1987_24106 [Smallanthus sonchifolius]
MVEGSSKLLRGLDWARSWALSETNQTLRRNSTRYRVTTSIVDESGSATTVFFYEVMASMVGISLSQPRFKKDCQNYSAFSRAVESR